MRRRSLIDLTPLLDVILLLVFGFMFVLASTNSLLFKAEEELDMSSNEYAAAIESLNEEIDALEKKVIVLEEANSAGEKTFSDVKDGVEQFFGLSRAELEKALSQHDPATAAELLDKYGEDSDIAYSMIMYELLANEFYFVEVVLRGEENRVYINDASTPIIIEFEDALQIDQREEKKKDIKDAISKVLDERQGGSSMAFVTLTSTNDEVYHYAWSIAWDAVKDLEEKYGAKNYYSAEIFIKREE